MCYSLHKGYCELIKFSMTPVFFSNTQSGQTKKRTNWKFVQNEKNKKPKARSDKSNDINDLTAECVCSSRTAGRYYKGLMKMLAKKGCLISVNNTYIRFPYHFSGRWHLWSRKKCKTISVVVVLLSKNPLPAGAVTGLPNAIARGELAAYLYNAFRTMHCHSIYTSIYTGCLPR